MRTLEEFQKEVLAPLREERDKKSKAAAQARIKASEELSKRKQEIQEKEHEFKVSEEATEKEFKNKQILERRAFKVKIIAQRADAHAKYQKANFDSKAANRRANEEYMDKLGIAFAEYNKERVTAGYQPISYNKVGEILAEERKGGYSEDGWPPLAPVPSDSIVGQQKAATASNNKQ